MIFDLIHVRIRIKLLGLVLLPIVGGGLLSGLQVAQQTRLLERLQRVRAASAVSGAVGDLAQALQAESDATALSRGPKGISRQGEVALARAETDRQVRGLEAAVAATDPGLRALLPRTVLDLGALRQLRQRGIDPEAPGSSMGTTVRWRGCCSWRSGCCSRRQARPWKGGFGLS